MRRRLALCDQPHNMFPRLPGIMLQSISQYATRMPIRHIQHRYHGIPAQLCVPKYNMCAIRGARTRSLICHHGVVGGCWGCVENSAICVVCRFRIHRGVNIPYYTQQSPGTFLELVHVTLNARIIPDTTISKWPAATLCL